MTLGYITKYSTINMTLKDTMASCFSLISWPSSMFAQRKDWVGPSLLQVWQDKILRY